MSKDKTVTMSRELAEQFLAGGRQCDRERLRALLDAPSAPVDAEQWYADTPEGDSALVTRVAALCNHPSMSFHQVALLEGAISESAVLAQEAGKCEPVRQVEYIGGYAGWRDVDEGTYEELKDDLRYKSRTLFTSTPAPVSVAVDLNDAEEFEKWWCATEVLNKSKLQIAQEAWKARARLDKVKELSQ